MDSFSHAWLPTTFLLPSEGGYERVDEKTAAIPLRIDRLQSQRADRSALTYLQYFHAISSALSKDDYSRLIQAVGALTGKDISINHIKEIRIFSEKHGSDYHPARIEVRLPEKKVFFVMNVAATERGRRRLLNEFGVLQQLEKKYGYPYLPRVFFHDRFACGAHASDCKGASLAMFLGEWFGGYHEFHITCNKEDQEKKIVLWDGVEGNHFLLKGEVAHVYEEAARILTLYFDIKTFEQIFPWHHAAGDFIVTKDDVFPRVRLITARQYAPMLDPKGGLPEEEGLLFFFLNLSLRMRLDRLDGTGDVVWADVACLDATVQGFKKGLETQVSEGRIPPGMPEAFFDYCRMVGSEGFSERVNALVGACDSRAPDMPVVRANLEKHMEEMISALRRFGCLKITKG
jgi:hypothetical protein